MPKANYLWISLESLIIMVFQITHHGSSAQGRWTVLLSLCLGGIPFKHFAGKPRYFSFPEFCLLETTLTTNSFLTTHSLILSALTLRKSH